MLLQDAVKILRDLLEGYDRVMGVKLRVTVFPKFSAFLIGEIIRRTPKSFVGARMCSRSSINMPSLVGLGFHPPPGQPKTLSF